MRIPGRKNNFFLQLSAPRCEAIKAITVISILLLYAFAPQNALAGDESAKACDQFSGTPESYSGQNLADELAFPDLRPEDAISACREAMVMHPEEARYQFQLARALQAKHVTSVDDAVPLYEPLAAQGNVEAMYHLGIAFSSKYMAANKVPNLKKAFRYFLTAAKLDFSPAMYKVALALEKGDGTEVSLDRSTNWLIKSAEAGYVNAMHVLAYRYGNGQGVKKDSASSLKWHRKAAEAGNWYSAYALSLAYEEGVELEKSEEKAKFWSEAANDLSFAPEIYEEILKRDAGRFGYPIDTVAAAEYYYYSISNPDAVKKAPSFGMLVAEKPEWVFSIGFKSKIQELLIKDGHYAGKVNGRFDEATKSAIRRAGGLGITYKKDAETPVNQSSETDQIGSTGQENLDDF